MALHDPLTDLPNRALLIARIRSAIGTAARDGTAFTVMVCDLDRFKAVNDSLGHSSGDKLLCAAARRILHVVHPTDMVARMGGDEFAIVVSDLPGKDTPVQIASRVIEVLCQPFEIDGRMVEVGASVGSAVTTGKDVDAEELLKHADIALYEAKNAGRNVHREFTPDAGRRATERGQLALDMQDAIRTKAFYLLYQPIVSLDTGRVVSFEALLRWRHPVYGDIPPTQFIPVAEKTGLIIPLGAWVLEEACREATRWSVDCRVAVNVSALQLLRDEFCPHIRHVLAGTGLAPRRLKLEVTESVLLENADAVLRHLDELQKLGISVELDDFGNGYSSLGYLRMFHSDSIKIDRSFIQDLTCRETAAIVHAILELGRTLGIGIIAEGAETAADICRIYELGCREVQGFFFDHPLPASDLEACLLACSERITLIEQATLPGPGA